MKQTEQDPAVIAKIKKLMMMADPTRGASAGEVENAMALMSKLMAQHNIDMSDISLKEEVINIEEQEAAHLRYWSQWEQNLMAVLKYLCEVEPLITTRQNKNPKATQREMTVKFVGTKHDTLMACEMYKILRSTIAKGGRQFKKYADSRSYCEGFVYTLINRAKEMHQQRSIGTAMIFVGKKTQALNNYKTQQRWGKHQPKRACGERTGSYYDGVRDGQKMDLGTKRRLA